MREKGKNTYLCWHKYLSLIYCENINVNNNNNINNTITHHEFKKKHS